MRERAPLAWILFASAVLALAGELVLMGWCAPRAARDARPGPPSPAAAGDADHGR